MFLEFIKTGMQRSKGTGGALKAGRSFSPGEPLRTRVWTLGDVGTSASHCLYATKPNIWKVGQNDSEQQHCNVKTPPAHGCLHLSSPPVDECPQSSLRKITCCLCPASWFTFVNTAPASRGLITQLRR
ncbi:hypothetical protein GN956_G6744 [Arapaima gigas]